ncbi:MerR family transcriptional regulator [Aestuariibacter sp. A3R04]|uniref:MerR family transcriptional regulator n=1 Tax=Aestuariibacter sp. A3R04 TaxID=2841571 RepID=UPI001C08F106|nr:MerR family transcriptional regulator [Aestuariibacter sp. A3R04]MBU3021680.1 MerR family transcriptional regulator [Aestuariibacter sp. A3R04]
MRISELAKASKVSVKTIRYYEQIALLPLPARDKNGYRVYTQDDVNTVIFIRRCRELNISVKNIKRIVGIRKQPTASCAEVDNIIQAQLQKIQQTQKELALLADSLQVLVQSCSNKQVKDCKILHHLNA